MKEIVKEFLAKIDILQLSVGILVMGAFLLITYALIYIPIPPQNQAALNILLGIISAGVGSLVGYYFGSSKGSQKKTDLIDKITDQLPK